VISRAKEKNAGKKGHKKGKEEFSMETLGKKKKGGGGRGWALRSVRKRIQEMT